MGRPSDFTQEIANKICERLADGESLRSICTDEDMPGRATVFQWLAARKEFADQYAHAREAQAETHVDEMNDIADEGSNDWMEKNDPDNPGYQFNGEAVQRSKLRIDTRKWVAERMKPKKYGKLIAVEVGVSDSLADTLAKARQRVADAMAMRTHNEMDAPHE
ncbi:MAG: terminase small subunit protein [bacterium]|nr:terminase small subunit protein [bacterium]